jgi:hypothetical protein
VVEREVLSGMDRSTVRAWTRLNAGLAMVVGALALAVLALLAARAFGGPLDPPGPPGSTRPIVEPRIPITQPASSADFPIVISQPGSYYLAANITGVSGKHGISISSNNVTIDLNGFHLVGVNGSLSGITVPILAGGLEIHNGVVRGWGGSGIEAGAARGVFEDLQLEDNGSLGLSAAAASIVTRVEARGHTGYGIQLANVGEGGRVEDCIATANGYGVGILGSGVTVEGCVLASNSVAGVDIGGNGNRVESNYFRGNLTGVRLLGGFNAIVGNLVIQTAASAYQNLGSDNHIGSSATIGSGTVSSTDQWSNIRVDP